MKILNTSIKTRIIFACAFFLFISGCAASSPLIKATKEGDTSTTEKLLRAGAKINESDERGYTPLMYAIWSGNTDMVNFLINKGADVNKRDNGGYSPLLWAASYGSLDMAKLLIARGADVNAANNEDNVALYYAAFYDDSEIANRMIKFRLPEVGGVFAGNFGNGDGTYFVKIEKMWHDRDRRKN